MRYSSIMLSCLASLLAACSHLPAQFGNWPTHRPIADVQRAPAARQTASGPAKPARKKKVSPGKVVPAPSAAAPDSTSPQAPAPSPPASSVAAPAAPAPSSASSATVQGSTAGGAINQTGPGGAIVNQYPNQRDHCADERDKADYWVKDFMARPAEQGRGRIPNIINSFEAALVACKGHRLEEAIRVRLEYFRRLSQLSWSNVSEFENEFAVIKFVAGSTQGSQTPSKCFQV